MNKHVLKDRNHSAIMILYDLLEVISREDGAFISKEKMLYRVYDALVCLGYFTDPVDCSYVPVQPVPEAPGG